LNDYGKKCLPQYHDGKGGIFLIPNPTPFHGIVVPLSDNIFPYPAFTTKRNYVYEKIPPYHDVSAVHLHG
jgi:hypothetical protein